jgi:peptidoglycan/LPS O-acetylase OafA/YrhL
MNPKRYHLLDAVRGLAALDVLVFHSHYVKGLWLGVQVFFVVSGYCIASATDSAMSRGLSIGTFMRRRVRRIAPPYLASVALALTLGVSGLLFGGRPGGNSPFTVAEVVQNATLTQWLTLTRAWLAGHPFPTAPDNPILLLYSYWSLCYEEQFYLLAGLLLVCSLRMRRPVLVTTAVVLGLGVAGLVHPTRVTGLLTDYWLQFSCGIVLYLRLCRVRTPALGRGIDLALGIAAPAFYALGRLRGEHVFEFRTLAFFSQLGFCCGVAFVLSLLRNREAALSSTWPVRALRTVGTFSYSLYLIHHVVLGLTFHLHQGLPPGLVSGLGVAYSIPAAYLFHRIFERPFLNEPLVPQAAPAQAVGTTLSVDLAQP